MIIREEISQIESMDTPIVPEPSEVYPESAFERTIAEVAQALLQGMSQAVIVPRFGLDIAVLSEVADAGRAAFIEVKSFNGQRQGGVGFGNARGEGPQVHLLLCNSCQMRVLDKHVRWAFVDARQPLGAPRYALIRPSQACTVVMGEVKKGKQNNFSISRLNPYWITWNTFCEDLSKFLLN